MLTGIVLLLVVGLLLLMAEVFLVPGVTFIGIAGIMLMVVGIWMAYSEYGQPIGHYILIASLSLTIIVLLRAFRTGFWAALHSKAP
jgi:membrane-bound ClpP family serine protease